MSSGGLRRRRRHRLCDQRQSMAHLFGEELAKEKRKPSCINYSFLKISIIIIILCFTSVELNDEHTDTLKNGDVE